MTKLLFINDPNCLEFQAEVTSTIQLDDGSIAALMPQTYFYPTGGGQYHDIGWIGVARVLDVVKQENDDVFHILDREISTGIHLARIDKARRNRNMQSHTAQHILSQTFKLEFGLNTLSSNISFDHPSTIDLNTLSISDAELKIVEDEANRVVFNNLLVKSYFISDKQLSTIPFRRPPKVSENIRVIEIDGFDYSACGGTHCDRTGSIGLIKILKTEIQNKKLRIHFIAGSLALEFFQETYERMKKIAILLETGMEQVDQAVNKQVDGFQEIRLKMQELKNKYLEYEKNRLLSGMTAHGNFKIITKVFEDLDMPDLRYLANALKSVNDFIVVLASYWESKLSMVVACSENCELDAREILDSLIEKYQGKGGGDKTFAQGGGKFQPGTLMDLEQEVINYLEDLKSEW
ncbi:DHHA1 domain-containing protein [Chloroflexota bacterium]